MERDILARCSNLVEVSATYNAGYRDIRYVYKAGCIVCAFVCKYDDAIACYIRSYELQTKPRYTDSLEAIAHIYEIKGEIKEAVITYQNILDLLNEDWNVTFGVTVNKYLQKINELKKG